MSNKLYVLIAATLIFFFSLVYIADLKWPYASERIVRISPLTFGVIDNKRMMPTHFYVDESSNTRVISDFANSRFIYRQSNEESIWNTSDMASLKRPHAITFHPEAKKFFAVDTDNHQLISFTSFKDDSEDNLNRYSEIGGFPIGKRPHDIAYNPLDGKIYTVLNSGILRFGADESGINQPELITRADIVAGMRKNYPDLSFKVGYIRSLTILDGVLFLSNSTQGNIIEIRNFVDPETWRPIINSRQPIGYAEKGNFDENGLIINDIEYFRGYWYASNYYVGNKSNYLSEAAVSKNKLIRWRTWEDFENSKWEDLSHLVHAESVTYNFTRTKDRLYISMFHNGNDEGLGSGVYEIKTSYF